MSSLSRPQVKLLSHILHSTSLALGRDSKLAEHLEKLSSLLGYKDWNVASAQLPEQIPDETHVAIALLEVPEQDAKTIMCVGRDSPWRLPEKIRDYLIDQSINPSGFAVTSYTRPDPVVAQKKRYFETDWYKSEGVVTTFREELDPNEVDYSPSYHTPIVMTFANLQGQFAFKLTVWLVSLLSKTGTATYFNGVGHKPLFNSIIQTITGHEPEYREGYCLVSSNDANNPYAIVRCNERGTELNHLKNLPYLPNSELWAQLKDYNDQLGLSLLDVAEITISRCHRDEDYDYY